MSTKDPRISAKAFKLEVVDKGLEVDYSFLPEFEKTNRSRFITIQRSKSKANAEQSNIVLHFKSLENLEVSSRPGLVSKNW